MNIIEKAKKRNAMLYKWIEKKLLGTGFSEIVYNGIVMLGITIALTFFLSVSNILPSLSILLEILMALSIFAILLLVWIGAKFFIHRKALDYLFKIERTPLKEYFREEIKGFNDIVEKITTDGVVMNRENVNMLTEALFKSGEGVYVGIESNLPSAYFKIYPKFLDHHTKYLRGLAKEEREEGKRILIAKDIGEIYNDSILNTAPYADFIEWHKRHDTPLLWIEKTTAERLCSEHKLKTTDIGLWKDSFAVFFSRKDEENYLIFMTLKESALFENVMNYIQEVEKNAQPLEIGIPIMQKELVEAWEGYVGCEKRLKEIGSFLIDVLGEYKEYKGRILDAAPGIGCEAIFLLQNGFDVSINEADPGFNTKLREKIKSVIRQKVEIYQHDWRKLSENFSPVYSGILVLGNSLCMMRGKNDRKKCIGEFYNLLVPGGKIIIDERNFSEILNKRENYERKKIMYMGDVIDFRLTFENRNLIRFIFFDVERPEKEIGYIVVEVLGKNEIHDILKTTGFENIEVYSDIEKGCKEDADFYTYVATKPEGKK